MKRKTEDISSRLPLLEAVLVIFIFVLLSGSIMTMYIAANRIRSKAETTSKALILAENVAEQMHTEGFRTGAKRVTIPGTGLSLDIADSGQTSLWLDKDLKLEGDSYKLTVSTDLLTAADLGLISADISITDKSGETFAALSTAVTVNMEK